MSSSAILWAHIKIGQCLLCSRKLRIWQHGFITNSLTARATRHASLLYQRSLLTITHISTPPHLYLLLPCSQLATAPPFAWTTGVPLQSTHRKPHAWRLGDVFFSLSLLLCHSYNHFNIPYKTEHSQYQSQWSLPTALVRKVPCMDSATAVFDGAAPILKLNPSATRQSQAMMPQKAAAYPAQERSQLSLPHEDHQR